MSNRLYNIVTIIQARLGSTRLPGKVLYEAAGKPILLNMYERVRNAKLSGNIVIATTNEVEDNVIVDLCKLNGINYFRGSTHNLLERHYKASLVYDADIIVKIPSDCPLIDPEIIDKVIEYYIKHRNEYDYVSNLHPQTYPDGNDVEVFSFNALYRSHKYARKNYEREHTTPYIWNNPGIFRVGNVEWETGRDLSLSHRFVLDYKEDFDLIREVYENLYYLKPKFSLDDILELMIEKPSLIEINKKHRGVSWYNNYRDDLKNLKNYNLQYLY